MTTGRPAGAVPIRLRNASLSVDVAPFLGGAITAARWHGPAGEVNFLRPATMQAIAERDFRRMSCFAMVPFASFVDRAEFRFAGERFVLRRNFPGRDVAIHGDGWQHEWGVIAQSDRCVHLSYDQSGDRFPFTYRAEQTVSLEPSRIDMVLRLTNTDERAMPAGGGFHPYFPATGAYIAFDATAHWSRSDRGVPVTRGLVPESLAFRTPRPVPERQTNELFAGWAGRARIHWPEQNLSLILDASPPLERLLLFVPQGEDCFCLEPLANIPDAFNLLAAGRPDTGTAILAPGETLVLRFGLEAEPLNDWVDGSKEEERPCRLS